MHIPSPFSWQPLCSFNLVFMCRVDRVTECGGDVGRLNVVGGAEVELHSYFFLLANAED